MKYRIITYIYTDKEAPYFNFYTEVKRWWGWTPLYYNGDEITWLSRYKVYPYIYTYAPHKDLEGAKRIIERHKEKYT